jgi:hypothetical protein
MRLATRFSWTVSRVAVLRDEPGSDLSGARFFYARRYAVTDDTGKTRGAYAIISSVAGLNPDLYS